MRKIEVLCCVRELIGGRLQPVSCRVELVSDRTKARVASKGIYSPPLVKSDWVLFDSVTSFFNSLSLSLAVVV